MMQSLTQGYLLAEQKVSSFIQGTEGNEQTGLLLNIVITVVAAGLVLAGVRTFIPDLWTNIMGQINNLWNTTGG